MAGTFWFVLSEVTGLRSPLNGKERWLAIKRPHTDNDPKISIIMQGDKSSISPSAIFNVFRYDSIKTKLKEL